MLNIQNQRDPSVVLKFNYGFGDQEEDDDDNPDPDYTQMVTDFRRMATQLDVDRGTRVQQRNPAIDVSVNIDYIRIVFQSQFVISKFYGRWRTDFGLLGVQVSQFGNEILFAVEDEDKFHHFLEQIDHFVRNESGDEPDLEYDPRVTYIRSFQLLTASQMLLLDLDESNPLLNFRLIDPYALSTGDYEGILEALTAWLQQQGLDYRYDLRSLNLEVGHANDQQVIEIIRNFDIVHQVTSSLATVIAPSGLGQPERSYGFTVGLPDGELPIAAIVDTGISNQTPLAPLLIQDEDYNLTRSSVFIDETNHGTALSALAALGRKAYQASYRGAIAADASLLSVKIMDTGSRPLSQSEVIRLLREVKRDYPAIKIFVLATCFERPKDNNADFSPYAYELDRFAHETDSLVFICTANNNDAASLNRSYDLRSFQHPITNLCPPAESMNNLTVGAAAGCFRPGSFAGISPAPEFPTLYTRKGHADLSLLFSSKKQNKNYFKPDLLEFAGDLEYGPDRAYIAAGTRASLQVLSSEPAFSFADQVGTSYATGLAANVGLRIQRAYPGLRAQTIKAILVNAASTDKILFDKEHRQLLNRTAGHGLLDAYQAVFSGDDRPTFIIEGTILPGEVNIYPIYFPDYLIGLSKNNALLKVNATLCFSVDPLLAHHLAYCPVHISFGLFRNQDGGDIQSPEEEIKSKIGAGPSWSQNGRYSSKPVPYSNVQKRSYNIGRDLLGDERMTLKLAVNCKVNPQLLPGTESQYVGPFAFSIAITFEENLPESKRSGLLYDEMIASNEIINIAGADGEALAEAEA